MKKYTVYRTTLSSIELEGKSLKDINSQIEEIDGDDEAWVYNDETFDVIEHGDGERISDEYGDKELTIAERKKRLKCEPIDRWKCPMCDRKYDFEDEMKECLQTH